MAAMTFNKVEKSKENLDIESFCASEGKFDISRSKIPKIRMNFENDKGKS